MSTSSDNAETETQHDAELLGTVLRGEFRIDEPLGLGGMSRVYRAHQITVDRDVVVKVMTPPPSRTEEWRARFMQEARAASRVSHPGIVTIFSFGEQPGVGPFIAMELVEGRTLRSMVGGGQAMAPGRACAIMAQVCRAMHAAHEVGVVHRDLKPDNIMIEVRDDREVARVLDFGIAKPDDSIINTLDEHVVGTPDYMAPEQARKRPIDARTDVYSAGIILFEMVSGRRPFSAPEPLALMFKHVNEPLPLDDFDPAWPSALRELLATACAKDPDDRFDSARDLAQALENIIEMESVANEQVSSEEFVVAPVETPASLGDERYADNTNDGLEDAPETVITQTNAPVARSRVPYLVLGIALGAVLLTVWISTPDMDDLPPAAPEFDFTPTKPAIRPAAVPNEPEELGAVIATRSAMSEVRVARERAAGRSDGMADRPPHEKKSDRGDRRGDGEIAPRPRQESESEDFHRVKAPQKKRPKLLEFED